MPILHLHRLNRILCLLAVLVLGSLTVAPAAYAHTLTVCPSGCDFTAIQPAIDSASSGDTIRIFSGVYLGGERDGFPAPIAVITDKSLVLEGVGATVLDCFGPGGCEELVQLSCSQNHQITIKRLTIQGGGSAHVGANLSNNGCELTLIDSAVIGSEGLAIEHQGRGMLTIKDSKVSDNDGGINISESKAFIINSIVNHNAGRYCGISNGGTLIVKHSSIVDNEAAGSGGGGIGNSGVAIIEDSLIADNMGGFADSLPRAGGIDNSGKLTLIRSTVRDNSAVSICTTCGPSEGLGGGIYNKGDVRLIDTMITKNVAGRDGGGVFNDGGIMLQTNTLIINNTPNDCVGC